MALNTLNVVLRSTDIMKEESMVNGVWSYIIGNYFPAPQWVIAPEYRTNDNKRGDLTVIHVNGNDVTSRRVHFNYEGKKKDISATDWQNGIIQLEGYLRGGDMVLRGGSGYGVFASGTKFMICKWNGTQLYRLSGSNLTDQDDKTAKGQAWDLNDDHHRDMAHSCMGLIRALYN